MTDDTVRVFHLRLEVGEAERARLWALLSADERACAERFRFDRDRHAFVAARGRLRELLGRSLDVAPEQVAFDYRPRGKPVLAGKLGDGGLHFNLSHSGARAVVALAHGCEVGVDIEEVRALPDAARLAERFFSAAEIRALQALAPADRIPGFFRCWTRKEAYLKALGDGLARPLDGFAVSVDADEPARLVQVSGDPRESERWTLHALATDGAFVGALAAEGRGRRLLESPFPG
jgi:4'-phosphopantetheinyl transferase